MSDADDNLKQHIASRVAEATQDGMPALKGTLRQRAFAEDVRRERLDGLISWAAFQGQWRPGLEESVRAWPSLDDAGWWLDNRKRKWHDLLKDWPDRDQYSTALPRDL